MLMLAGRGEACTDIGATTKLGALAESESTDRDQENVEAEAPVVLFDTAASRRLADLHSILGDLNFVLGCLARIRDSLDKPDADVVVQRALWTSALIAYSRCWTTGKREGLPDAVLSNLEGEPFEFHKLIRDLRDKYVAHSVNAFEEALVGVAIVRRADGGHDLGVAMLSLNLISLDRSFVEPFGRLVTLLRAEVLQRIERVTADVRAEAETEGIEQLLRRPPLRKYAPGPGDAGKAR